MNEQQRNVSSSEGAQHATLGGGCFWCLEPVFKDLRGVQAVVVGYAGGSTPNPNYQQVCSGMTGHAEVVQIHFDPVQISYQELLGVFFGIHDPTTPDRQGADVGTQYRSIILYHDEDQKKIAEEVVRDINETGMWKNPIVTEIVPLEIFYRAEEYHQAYYEKNPHQGYCMAVVAPKVAKFRKHYQDRLKKTDH